MNFYNISQIPERQQIAQHYHSSIQQPNLQNVEAQLYAARQRNYQLSRLYFQNKYGSGQLFNKYIENNSLQGLGAPQQPVYDFKRQLQIKAIEIQQEQMKKIANRKKGAEQKNYDKQYDSKRYKKSNQKQNIWDRPKQHKVQFNEERNQVEERPYEINIGKETEKAFISQFKSYLINKKKIKEEQGQYKAKFQQTVTSQLKDSNFSILGKSQIDKQICYEEKLVKKIFRDLAGRVDKNTRIQKIAFIEYLNSNPKILKVLNTTPENVSQSILSQQCKDSNLLTVNDGIIWVYNIIGKNDAAKKLKAQQQFEEVPSGCMLSKQLMQLFEDTFRAMDRHNDLIIKRVPFIGRLTSQPLVKKNLNAPAVFEPQYSRHVSLRRIFERIQIQTLLCNEEQRKVNQYISWNQFVQYFQSGHKQRGKYDLIVLVESLKNEQKFGLSNLPDSVADIISASFKNLDQGEEMFNTTELITEIKLHKEYEVEKYTFLKPSGGDNDSVSQTFEDVLMRIKERGLKYVNPKQFLEYFSDKGKPIQQFEQERIRQQSKFFSPTKVSFIEKEIFNKNQEAPDGYDSDPQMYNNSQLQQKDNQGRKSQRQFKRFKQTSKSFLQPESKIKHYDEEIRDIIKITIPQPFSFEQREKDRKLVLSQQKAIQTIPQKRHFKAEPVPSKVAQVGLYQKMITEQQKKNQERKRSSMIMTLANERPFSFQDRKTNKKTKQQREEFIFHAKPIPWYCSVDLLARKKQQQIIRKQKIAKAAQQNLTKAKLPPRMEKDFLQKQAKKALSPENKNKQTQSAIKVRDPPDFNKLHKNFQQAMERKRKENKTTQIKQFRFSSTSKANASKIKAQNSYMQSPKKSKIGVPSYITKSNVDIFAQSTIKFTQQVEKRRQQIQQKRKIQAKKKQEQQQRSKIDEELKNRVQQAAKRQKENKEKEIAQMNKQKNAQQLANYKARKNAIIDKARKQPMLMDRVSKRDQKIQKMKKLWEISQTLKKNGIKGKEHDHYFKREELLLLDDYKILRDKI